MRACLSVWVTAIVSSGAPAFPTVDVIKYEGADSLNPLAFKHYNAKEVVAGKVCATFPTRHSVASCLRLTFASLAPSRHSKHTRAL